DSPLAWPFLSPFRKSPDQPRRTPLEYSVAGFGGIDRRDGRRLPGSAAGHRGRRERRRASNRRGHSHRRFARPRNEASLDNFRNDRTRPDRRTHWAGHLLGVCCRGHVVESPLPTRSRLSPLCRIIDGGGIIMSEPWYQDGLRFECTRCGKCCSGFPGFVWVSEAELQAIADFRGETL